MNSAQRFVPNRRATTRPSSKGCNWLFIGAMFWACSFGGAAKAQQISGEGAESPPSTNESVVYASRIDARLNDIVALSADRLCAVGDCGTILITENAGRVWKVIDSSTTDPLFAVRFADSRNGIAVGGSIGRFTGISRATILRTTDGGETWEQIENDLPLLRGLARSVGTDETKWISWGDFDPARTTSVFQSANMGQTWEATPAKLGSTVACDLGDASARSFLAWDLQRNCQFVDQKSMSPVTARQLPAPPETTLGLHNSGRSWIAYGASGLLERSMDGQAWESIPVPLSPESLSMLSWQGVSQMGEHLWVCGSPGSVLLHSNDFGENWRKLEVPNTLPLQQTAFVDANRGWAVGALGTVLATRDGGESWYRQRGAKAVGVLAISHDLQSTPWDALGTNAWETKRTSAAILLGNTKLGNARPNAVKLTGYGAREITQPNLELASGLNVGGISVQTTSVDLTSSPTSLGSVIGTYAPDTIIAPEEIAQTLYALIGSKSNSISPLASASLSELGLSQPLASIQKIVVPCAIESADFQDSTQRILKGVGVSTWDVLFALPPELQNKKSSNGYKTLWCRSQNAAAKTSLVGGIVQNRDAERNLPPKQLGNYQLVMGRVHRQKLLSQLQSTKLPPGDWNERLSFAIARTPGSERSTHLWAMYQSLRSEPDEWKQDFVLQQLARQTDDHDASTWAMIQILQRVASSEVQHARESKALKGSNSKPSANGSPPVISAQFRTISDTETPWNASPFSTLKPKTSSSPPTTEPQVVTAGATRPLPSATAAMESADRWFQLMGTFSQTEPRLLTLPSMQMMDFRVALTRTPGSTAEVQRLERLLESPLFGVWQRNALQELRMERRRFADVRGLLLATRAEQRPQLDGKLSEGIWKQSTPMPVSSSEPNRSEVLSRPSGDSSVIRWSYDEDFLYAGIQCSSSGRPIPAAPRQRTYDTDLSKMDRVEFHIDTNRDYATSFQFGVAANGETFDRCDDLTRYNPTWYVAVSHQKSGSWSAEVAIAREALTKTSFPEQIWGITAVRIPNSATQVSLPPGAKTALESPHYLMFAPNSGATYQPARVPASSQGRRITELPPLNR
ncbi:MAG: YCF48-related protein [Aureliella sp.]